MLYTATSTSVIYTLSLHDALPILILGIAAQGFEQMRLNTFHIVGHDHRQRRRPQELFGRVAHKVLTCCVHADEPPARSEEHTSELQSRGHLVCRLLLERKNATTGF